MIPAWHHNLLHSVVRIHPRHTPMLRSKRPPGPTPRHHAQSSSCLSLYLLRSNSHRAALMAPTSSPTKTSRPIGIVATFRVAARATITSDHENHPSCFTTGWSSSTVILRCGFSTAHPGSSRIWSNAGITVVDVDPCSASIIGTPFLRAPPPWDAALWAGVFSL